MAEDKDFRALLGDDVKPLKMEKRETLIDNKISAVALEARKHAAQTEVAQPQDPLAGEPLEMLEPFSLVEFKRPGVQNGVYKNVRLGKYAVDARLDLHKMPVERARLAVYQFVSDCVQHDVRTALITHGKGEGRAQPALLKSYVAHWLPQLPAVLAFHTAQKQHGGYGATYVLLKKSEKNKQKNKLRHERNKGA